jgi:hypothetical protein
MTVDRPLVGHEVGNADVLQLGERLAVSRMGVDAKLVDA